MRLKINSKQNQRVGEEKLNNQGCLMRIIKYYNTNHIVVEFQDNYKYKSHTKYDYFLKGCIKNPYCPNVYDVGIIGYKYPSKINGKSTKEYNTWNGMIRRCFNEDYKKRNPVYKNTTCCSEWLLYENFYEWLYSQKNFEKWIRGNQWALDKDILIKGNKVYSPQTCSLVPQNVNTLFVKSNIIRGDLPIGVFARGNRYGATCHNPFTNKQTFLGYYDTVEKAFLAYKKYKESLIKQVAQEEFNKGNITEKCYQAMMNYTVEITD